MKGGKRFYVHCGDCSHQWTAFWLPIKVDLMTRFKDIACPKCGGTTVFVSRRKAASG